MKKGYVVDIETKTEENNNFREVLYTAGHMQLVVMSLAPQEDIGTEVHELDQFIRVEEGEGKAILNGIEYQLKDGSAVVVPEGVEHNIVNTSETEAMKLYTLYAPAHHRDGIIHATKAIAEADDEEFDGIFTE